MDKMKLGIFCNFTYPSCGGSEEVCRAIAEKMCDYGMEVISYGYNVSRTLNHNGVQYKKCLRGNSFLNQINEVDHAFIYSDSFWGFETILNNIEKVKSSLSIVLLGMYNMIGNPRLFRTFKENSYRFNIITHSDCYQDYKECLKARIPVTVVPNGVRVEEFPICDIIDIREKYCIFDKKIILNVSNYFYGKGQEYLSDVALSLKDIRPQNDFIFAQLSNDVKYPHDKKFLHRAKNKFSKTGVDCLFLRNLSRGEVLSFFELADVSVLTSLKEVAPLVLLESMASKTPWVSLDVGNAEQLWGGTVLVNKEHDSKGYKVFSKKTAEGMAELLNVYLNCPNYAASDAEEGLRMVSTKYTWDLICKQYYNMFMGEKCQK